MNDTWREMLAKDERKEVASVVCFKGDKVLILLRSATDDIYPNHWDLPGGHVDKSDGSIENGVIRELFEETGLRVKQADLFYVAKKTFENTNKYFFVTSEWSGEVVLERNPKTGILEHSDYKWASIDEVKELTKSIIPTYLLEQGRSILDAKL